MMTTLPSLMLPLLTLGRTLWHAARAGMVALVFGLTPQLAGGVDTEVVSGAAEAVQLWASTIWIESSREIYFGKFIDKNPNAIIESKTELNKTAGEKLTYSFSRKLQGGGVINDGLLEGQEEDLPLYSDSLTLFQIRNAVRLAGQMSIKRTAFDQHKLAKTQLTTWLAEYVDDNVFVNMDNNPTTAIFAGTATSTATLASTDLFTPALIDKAVTRAKKASPKIYPVKLMGRELYVMLIHVDVSYDIKVGNNSGTWQTVQQYAGVRDLLQNRIFSGALGFWGGAIIHEHEKVPTAVNWGAGSNVNGASNMFMGRQAGIMAWGSSPKAWTKEFDYSNRPGFAIGVIFAFKKAIFNGVDHGYVAVRCARTSV